MSASYINPKLPSMIRNLHKSDPAERSVQVALGLAADLIEELIDLKPRAEAAEATLERVRALCVELDDGGRCGVQAHSKSGAAAAAHRRLADAITAALAAVSEEGDKE